MDRITIITEHRRRSARCRSLAGRIEESRLALLRNRAAMFSLRERSRRACAIARTGRGLRHLIGAPGQPVTIGGADVAAGVLTCWTEEDGTAVTLHIRGEIDLASAGVLEHALSVLEPDGRRVIVDLSDVEYIDLTGLRLLEEAARRFETRGGGVVACSPSAVVRRLFEVVRIAEIPVVPTYQAARETIARRSS